MQLLAQPRRAVRGLTLVELSVVLVVLLVAVSIYSNTLAATARQRVMQRESSLAAEAARTALERMLNTPFRQRYALFNADPLDDPGGAGTAPGSRFAVAGLPAVAGVAGGRAGEIRFPVLNVGTAGAPAWELREDVVDAALSMPRDLDSNFRVDALDHAEDYTRLPVEVVVEWQGRVGRQRYRLISLMVEIRR
jgi:prepilin-type N-terminal cleavage/methylation domain-containing protein